MVCVVEGTPGTIVTLIIIEKLIYGFVNVVEIVHFKSNNFKLKLKVFFLYI